MKKTSDCALTQLAIECVIGAYGIRCANKKSHHAVRDAAVKEIVNTLHWYQILCEVADRKGN